MRIRHKRLNNKGYNLPEFCATFVVFTLLVLVIAFGSIVPFRYMLANGMVASMVHKAALAEKRSLSSFVLSQDPCIAFAQRCGIEFGAAKIAMVCINKAGATVTIPSGCAVPKDWLPGGKNAPCTYLLQLSQPATIKTLITSDKGLPGVTAPLKVNFNAASCWENLGCDPVTKDFFINE